MDNVTHTLVGITFSNVLVSGLRGRKKTISEPEKRAVFWTAVLGNNLPDIDSLWTFFRRNIDGNLSYLLEHRGYTHTLLGALPMGVIAAGLGCLIARIKLSRSLVLIGVLSIFLHIGADTLNDYGVHPFSPFLNRWYYGDSVFILEPFLWMTMIPLAVATVAWKPGRWIWSALWLGLVSLLWFGHYTPYFIAVFATVWGLGFAFMERRRWGVGPVLAGLFLLVFGFSFSSHRARIVILDHLGKNPQGELVQDIVTTPAPGNPFCWNAWLVTQNPEDYISRNAVVSLWPGFADPETCFPNRGNLRTAPLSSASLVSDSSIHWLGDYHLSRRIFQDWSWKNQCFRSFLGFSRLPFLAQVDGHWVAGDLRYDRGQGKGFAQVDLEGEKDCATSTSKWDPPFLRFISK